MSKVQWPDGAYSTSGDDLSEPIQALLQDMNLLEKREVDGSDPKVPKGLGNQTPFASQVITAGATSLSKLTATFVAAFGSLSAGVTAVLAFTRDLDNSTPLMLVLVGSLAVVVSATLIGLAIIVKADLSARAGATSAEYRARAETAAALLHGFGRSRPAPTPEPRYWTKTKNGDIYPVKGFRFNGGEVFVEAGGQNLKQSDLELIAAYAEWQPNGA